MSVNLGEILNEKKYRVVNTYPLGKCYDKSAKLKLAVDFVPQNGKGAGERMVGGNVKFGSSMQVQGISNTNITRNPPTIGNPNSSKTQFP